VPNNIDELGDSLEEKGKVKVRREIITARQIGLIVALGGLGYAWVAMGFLIPLYPPMIWDVREPCLTLAAAATGPYGGIITGIIHGIGTGSPVDLLYYPVMGLVVGALSKRIWAPGGWKRIAVFSFVVIICEFFINGLWAILATDWFYGIPFWTFAPMWWSICAPVYSATEIIVFAAAVRLAPDLIRPRWSWRGGEIVEQ